MSTTGTCALCGQHGQLIDSPFLPAALYQEMNDPTGPIKNMIVVTPKGTFQSPEQFHMPLLCQACEIRFQKGGENWVLAMRYRSDGSFPLRDLIQAATPANSNGESDVYDICAIPGLEVEQVLYFAASIFWRAGIASWSTKFADATKIDLRPEIMAKFADYLLARGPFPAEAYLMVSVARDATPQRFMLSPLKDKTPLLPRYEAHIPGMMFELFVDAPSACDAFSLNNSPKRIVLTELVTKRALQIAGGIVPNSQPKAA